MLAGGAKDERIAARFLRALGHDVKGAAVDEKRPYFVTLAASLGGRTKQADLECTRCGAGFEVKGRPNDSKLHFSHSTARTFAQENRPQDFQVLVERTRSCVSIAMQTS